ncbi:rhodanese-like domain-containing protein [Salinibacillus xinjiangensis]|uniref:Rhodanese-like domain-containing protein n=1 Tax=Salinibacillus xinjiangensis TaxID=1229268 RepID=A0A6G1X490_9BACI|nr:rhodanese-like domain-containing protein [Salinibacillus xinjiangensis]MRG85739.1 rhodanese-like domain-containing protein [Salinibacillus xinjiangensis]
MAKEVTPKEVAGRLQNGEEVYVIDVRENSEVAEGKIPGAKHIPLGQLAIRKEELDPDKSYVVVCRSGNRSKAACGILGALGYQVEDMLGGMQQWEGELE